MKRRFRKHYTLEEARTLLPQVREWLQEIHRLRHQLQPLDQRIEQLLANGDDIGGDSVQRQTRLLADLQNVVHELFVREIQIKDIDRGLVDFPSIMDGREVFLCWEMEDEDIEFWHELDTGYAGRERL